MLSILSASSRTNIFKRCNFPIKLLSTTLSQTDYNIISTETLEAMSHYLENLSDSQKAAGGFDCEFTVLPHLAPIFSKLQLEWSSDIKSWPWKGHLRAKPTATQSPNLAVQSGKRTKALRLYKRQMAVCTRGSMYAYPSERRAISAHRTWCEHTKSYQIKMRIDPNLSFHRLHNQAEGGGIICFSAICCPMRFVSFKYLTVHFLMHSF